MPLLLIGVRENRWHKDPARALLERGDVPADPIGDLRTTNNQLSVWEILADRSNRDRIVRALNIGKDHIADSGWLLFSSELLEPAGIKAPVATPGRTKDKGVNHWHRDLVDLSGNLLVALTRTLLVNAETGTILKKEMLELIEAGIKAKELAEKDLPDKMVEGLTKARSQAGPHSKE